MNPGSERLTRSLAMLIAGFSLVGITGCGDSGGSGTGPFVSGARVYGRVLDSSDDTPMEGAQISATAGGEEVANASTDSEGRFVVQLPGAGAYAMTARKDGYTYAQRAAEIKKAGVEAVRPMYLTPIDTKPIVVGPAGGRGFNSDGSMELVVPAGALGAETDMRATWYKRGDTLPNDLPVLSHFTYAAELTTDGSEVFEKPVTVRMKNTRGFAPGTSIPVGVYSPDTLKWEHETMGLVSEDGEWVDYDVNHFSPRDCNLGRMSPAGSGGPGSASDGSLWDRMIKNNRPCSALQAGSFVGVADGHLTVEHGIPGYLSLGERRSLHMQYNSAAANPSTMLWLTYDITQTAVLLPDRIRFVAEIGGNRVERVFEPVEMPMSFGYQWDGKDTLGNDLPDGNYDYRMTLINEYSTTFAIVDQFGGEAVQDTGVEADELLGLESVFEGSLELNRLSDTRPWPLGTGWGIVGVHHLEVKADGVVRIEGGDNSIFGFKPVEGGGLEPMAGGFSTLAAGADGTYTWTWQDRTVVEFDGTGRQTRQTDPEGNATRFEYDDAGRLISVHDPVGRTTALSYDGQGHLESIMDPAGRKTAVEVGADGDLTGITNPDGSQRTFTYKAGHWLTSQVDGAGRVTTYTYDASGSVQRVDRPDGSHTAHVSLLSISDDETAAGWISYTDGAGGEYQFGVNAFGTRTLIRDPLGRDAMIMRNANDQVRFLSWPGDEGEYDKGIGYHYDDRGNLTNAGAAGTTSDYAAESMVFEYDDANRPVSITDGTMGAWIYEYEGVHATPSKVTVPDGRVCTFTLDERGLRTAADLAGRKFAYQYDGNGNLAKVTGPDMGLWTYSYDDRGNVTGIQDPEGRQTTTEYNVMDLPVKISAGVGKGVRFDYSPAKGDGAPDAVSPSSMISAITDGADDRTLFAYDGRDRITAMTDPLGKVTSYEYDGEGRLLKRTLPNNQTATWEYNKAGQVTAWRTSSGDDCTYTYGEASGLLRTAVAPACTTTLEYDRGFRVSAVTHDFADGFSVKLTHEYMSASSSEWTTNVESGEDWWYATVGYQDSKLLPDYVFAMGDGGVGLLYDNVGLTTGWESWSGWVSAAFQRNDAGRLTAADYTDSWDATAVSLSLTYSDAGLLTGFTGPEGHHGFTYDQAGRITSATHPKADNPDESFTWDAAGNRRMTGQEAEYQYDAARRLLQDPDYTYQYDNAGNRVLRQSRSGGGDTSYEYDGGNRLQRVTVPGGAVVEYRYDGLDRRVERWVDGILANRYLWNVDDVLAEFDGTGKLSRSYIPILEPDMNLGVSILAGDGYLYPHYYAADDLGTVYALLDDDGAIVESYRYSAFGRPVGLPANPVNSRLFAGMDYDPVTGLYYARARWYDPEAGLFLQRDPIPMKSAVTPYGFADDRPGNTRDPSGMDPQSSWKAESTIINNQVVQPTVDTATTEAVSRIPKVGGKAAGVVGVVLQAKDLIKVITSKDPLKAGRDWYKSQWWNPAGKYVDSFLSLGGDKSGKDKGKGRINPRCGPLADMDGFIRR